MGYIQVCPITLLEVDPDESHICKPDKFRPRGFPYSRKMTDKEMR